MFTNQSLLGLLEAVAGIGVTSASSSPTQQQLITYLCHAQSQVARDAMPAELWQSTPSDITTTQSVAKYSLPVDIAYVTDVYHSIGTSSDYKKLNSRSLGNAINPGQYFSSAAVGEPLYYDIRGQYLCLDKGSSVTGATIKVFGYTYPSMITTENLGATNEFDDAYKMALVHFAAYLYSLSDSAMSSVNTHIQLYQGELAAAKVGKALPTDSVTLDSNFFKYGRL